MLAKVVFKKNIDSTKLAMVVIIHHPPYPPPNGSLSP